MVYFAFHSRTAGMSDDGNGVTVALSAYDDFRRRALADGGTAGDEPDVKVPLIGDGRIRPLSPQDTEALVEASEEAVRAESSNPIAPGHPIPFSTRHASP